MPPSTRRGLRIWDRATSSRSSRRLPARRAVEAGSTAKGRTEPHGQGSRPQRAATVPRVRDPPGQTSWSKAFVRHGADPRVALASVLGVSAGIFG
jgi:hypothetical protein